MSALNYNENWILYDGECPFCARYVKMLRLKEAIGPVRLLNARENPPELAMVREKNLDIDEGMVFYYQGELYYGDQAICMMAAMSSGSNMFNKFNAWVFKSPKRAAFLYPFLRCGRNLVLKLLGRKKIDGTKF